MILAGDIGGTKTILALFRHTPGPGRGRLERVAAARYASAEFPGLQAITGKFLKEHPASLTAAGFGVAGAVANQEVRATNVPWVVRGRELAASLRLRRVTLLNDFEALGYGLELLEPSDLATLNTGTPMPGANQALIGAGTGLGEAILFEREGKRIVSPSEGGHSDFCARDDREARLLLHLKKTMRNVCCEEVLSGRGFRRIHEFLDPAARHASFDSAEDDPAREITELARAGKCPVCSQTLDWWINMYGAEAGNFALKVLARGGVYVAGGIALKLLPEMKAGQFVESFCDKSFYRTLLSEIPIQVVLNQDTPLLGAAGVALAEAAA